MIEYTAFKKEKIIEIIYPPLINRAELARRMFPNNKTPEQALKSKLRNVQNKKVTNKNCENVIRFLKEFSSGLETMVLF